MSDEDKKTGNRKCPRCGVKNPRNRKFCRNCFWDMDLPIKADISE